MGEGNVGFCLRNIYFILVDLFYMPYNFTTRGIRLYFTPEWCAADYYRPQKSVASDGFQPANLESNGKHTNQYSTEVTGPFHNCDIFEIATEPLPRPAFHLTAFPIMQFKCPARVQHMGL
jgi:hypothetical protein